MVRFFSLCAVVSSFSFILLSCSSIEKIQGQDKAETFYLRGLAYLEDSMYNEALERFNIVKNKFPYSKYAIDAELKIGDTYYKKGDFVEAQRVYSVFSELRPSDPKRDYAIYQSGMCFYKLTPSAVDRDISMAFRGIQEFQKLIETYPDSTFFYDASERRKDLRTRLAKKEIYIGDFYRRKRKYDAAIDRYKAVLNNYTNLGFDESMYYKIAESYYKLGSKDELKYYTDFLIVTAPGSPYAKKAIKLQRGL